MRRLFLVFLMLGAVFKGLQAQQAADKGFIARGRHSLGINLYPVISHLSNMDNYYPFEVTYKLQVKSSDRAWRFGVQGQYDEVNHYHSYEMDGWDELDEERNKQNYLLAGGYVGHEWQSLLGKRWLLAYGVDLGYSYQQTYNYGTMFDRMDNTQRKHTVFIKAFTEINFAVTCYLIVNAGVCFMAEFQDDRTYPAVTSSPSPPSGKTNLQLINVRILPFQQIGITYVF